MSAQSFRPKDGFAPNEKTAVHIAEAVLSPIYGEEKIVSERPFSAKLKGDVWTVTALHYFTALPSSTALTPFLSDYYPTPLP